MASIRAKVFGAGGHRMRFAHCKRTLLLARPQGALEGGENIDIERVGGIDNTANVFVHYGVENNFFAPFLCWFY